MNGAGGAKGGGSTAQDTAAIGVGIIGSGLQAETHAASLVGHLPGGRFVSIFRGSRAAKLGRAPEEYLSATNFGHADLGSGLRLERLASDKPSDASVVARDDLRRIGTFIAEPREIVDGLRGLRPRPGEGRDGVLAIAAEEACRRSAASG